MRLGDLTRGSYSAASGVSADGSVVVGNSSSAAGIQAFVWDAGHGMRSLRDALIAGGADLTGWTLFNARGISADGRTVVGEGIDPAGHNEAWLARLNTGDTTAPVTSVTLTGPAGGPGWYAGPVAVSLSAADPDDPPAALTTTYSVDGGPSLTYAGPFTIATDGAHQVAFRSRDPAGNLEPVRTVGVSIDNPTPLTATGLTVNGGGAQRSNIESVSVRFNKPTNLGQLIAANAIGTAVTLSGSAGVIPLSAARYRYDPATLTLVIDLSIDGFGGSQATMLANGRYQLRFDVSAVTTLVNPANHLLDDDSTADGWLGFGFHRLRGDFDGDGVVSLADRAALLGHFGPQAGQAVYDFAYDLNGDGVINSVDYLLWTRLLGGAV
jgi:hypothetical protein